jgi:hypothetical protein
MLLFRQIEPDSPDHDRLNHQLDPIVPVKPSRTELHGKNGRVDAMIMRTHVCLLALGFMAWHGRLQGRSSAEAPARAGPIAESCGSVATFADGKSPILTRHVATTGNDRGNGSGVQPFRTLARAAREVLPGTAIYLHAGIYDGGILLDNLRGSAGRPIWITGVPQEPRPIIQGGREGLHLRRPNYVIVQQLEVRNTMDNGINVDDGDDVSNAEAAQFVLFRDINVHDTGGSPSGIADCLKMAGVNGFYVFMSAFARCGAGPQSGAVGIGGVGVHRGVVAANQFARNGYGGAQFKGGSSDIEVRANIFQDTGWRGINLGGSTGESFFRPPLSASAENFEAARLRVVANVFIGSETAASFAGCRDCDFSHNTVVNPSKWLIRILNEGPSSGPYRFLRGATGLIDNNIFYFRRADLNAGEDVNVGANADTKGLVLERNLWYAHDSPARSAPGFGFQERHTESLVGLDPGFIDPRSNDFHLKAGSQAKGAGRPMSTRSGDFDGRCYGTPPSLGAFE